MKSEMVARIRTGLQWLFMAVLLLIMGLGVLSIVLPIKWQTDNSKNQIKSITLLGKQSLTVDYPSVILAEDKPTQIAFSLPPDKSLNEPLTLTVKLPPGLLRVTSSQTYRDGAPTFVFQPNASIVQTYTLQIINARLKPNSEVQPVALVFSDGTIVDPLTFTVEGTYDFALRSFFGNSQNILFGALASAVGLIYQWIQKQRELEEEKKHAIQEKDTFRKLMCQGEIIRAREVYERLKASGLIKYLEQRDQDIMSSLLIFAGGESREWTLGIISEGWLNESAGAFLFAHNHGFSQDQELRNTLRELIAKNISDELKIKINEVLNLTDQAREWPPRLVQLKPTSSKVETFADLATIPFRSEYAEDDEPFLFPGVFWSEHALFKKITQSDKTEIIVGGTGVGKSALALALAKYLHDPQTLTCYLPGLPDERDVERALTKRLLDFVCHLPLMLRGLRYVELTLLARVFADILDRQVVLAALEKVSPEKMLYVQEVAGSEREKRERYVKAQIKLLSEILTSLAVQKPLSHREWSDALTHCARALDFKLPVRIVVDTSNKEYAKWINEFLFARVAQWRTGDIIVKIFVPSNSTEIELEEYAGWLESSKLEWDTPLLAQMLDHRFNTMMETRGSHLKRPAIIGDEFWNLMIARSNNNPRAFFRLWNQMLKLAPPEQWSESLLNQALE